MSPRQSRHHRASITVVVELLVCPACGHDHRMQLGPLPVGPAFYIWLRFAKAGVALCTECGHQLDFLTTIPISDLLDIR